MNSRLLRMQAILACWCMLACLSASAIQVQGQQPNRGGAEPFPRVFLLEATYLAAARVAIKRGDKNIGPAWAKLQRDAEKALAAGAFSIVNKAVAPPSGDKHDYMSQ